MQKSNWRKEIHLPEFVQSFNLLTKGAAAVDFLNKAGKVIDKTLKPKLLPPQTIKSTDKVKINDTEYKRNKDGYKTLYR